MHDDQEFTSSIQVEMLMQPAKLELKMMLETLFDEVCFGLSLSRFFDSHETPSFFVIYTHENPAPGKADSRIVHKLIEYLEKISSKCRSDRGPTLRSDYLGSKARDDILENQFCLLPEDVSDTSVDKVLLFYSEALKDYCAVPEGRKYMKTLESIGLQGLKELQRNVHDESVMSSATAQSVKASIRAVVETHTEESWFHHVLTEIGLVHLRTTWDNDPYPVIPVDLHDSAIRETAKRRKQEEDAAAERARLIDEPERKIAADAKAAADAEAAFKFNPKLQAHEEQERERKAYDDFLRKQREKEEAEERAYRDALRKQKEKEEAKEREYQAFLLESQAHAKQERERKAYNDYLRKQREEKDTEEKDTEEADIEEEDTEEADIEEADIEEADTEEKDTEEADIEEADIEEEDTEEADIEEEDTEEADIEEADIEEEDTEEADIEEEDTEEADIEEADTEEKAYRDALRKQKEKQEAEEKAKKEEQSRIDSIIQARLEKLGWSQYGIEIAPDPEKAEKKKKKKHRQPGYTYIDNDIIVVGTPPTLGFENDMYQAPPHVLPQAMRENLGWLTFHTTYQEWLLRDHGLLGLRGGPGSGKSTALSHLLQEARREERNTHTVLSLSFQNPEMFRWDSRKRMYGTLLYNLMAEQSKLKTEFLEWTNEDWKARSSADDLRGFFLDVVTKALEEGPIRIFLDSLDNVGDSDAREVIADLRFITRTLEGVATGLSICFTCRSYPSITVDNGLEIRLEQNNRNGIKHYVRSEVRPHIRDRQASDEFLETISTTVANNSMGNFLCAVRMTGHAIDLLARFGPDPDNIIREVNKTLEIRMSIYRRILDQNIRNRPYGLRIAETLIQLIQFSQRQISVEELRCLLVLDKSFMRVVRHSASNESEVLLNDEVAMTGLLKSHLADLVKIVDITDQSGTTKSVLKFVNDSVAEWIWRSDEMASVFHTCRVDWRGLGHDRVARVCYNFIKAHREDWNNLSTQALKANLDYATTYWFDHAAIAEAGGVSQVHLEDLLSGKEGKLVLRVWAKASGRRGLARRCLPLTPSLRDIARAFYIASLFE
ncbi:hypothetical protein KCU99_g7589, partial [Aureobasidium melanogenum]